MVCKETASCPDHGFLFPEEIQVENERRCCLKCGKEVSIGRVEKMSKSKKNVIDPTILLEKYGADTTRLFCLFAAPPERDLEWSEQGVEGGFRFLSRVWRLAYVCMPNIKDVQPYAGSAEGLENEIKTLFAKIHETIKRVTRDIENRFHFNTAISAIMELVNVMQGVESLSDIPKKDQVIRFGMETIALLLSPIVPHFAEELWEAMGNEPSVNSMSWPTYREDVLVKDEFLIVVQVNGKVRSRFNVSADATEEQIKRIALSDERTLHFVNGNPIKKVIVVKQKLVNIVV
jgi:leucyl-tRNA synthetase